VLGSRTGFVRRPRIEPAIADLIRRSEHSLVEFMD
jgi:hypothetical protein